MFIETAYAGRFNPATADSKTLWQAKADIRKEVEKILFAAEDAGRALSDDERSRISEFEGSAKLIEKNIKRALDDLEREKALPSVQSIRLDGWPADDKDLARGPSAGPKFQQMFKSLRPSPWRSGDEFLAAVCSGRYDERLQPVSIDFGATMQEGVDPTGGYSVPEELSSRWLDVSLEGEIVRPRAQIWPMKSETRKVPGFKGGDHSSALFGGLTAAWMAETSEGKEVDPELRLMGLKASKLACFARVSNELIQDGLGFEQQLNAAIPKTIGWYLDYACLRGSGAGQPLGVLNDSARITVAKESGQTAATINYVNLTNMFARLHPACLSRSLWVANSTAIPQLLTLSIEIGDAGAPVPVLKESDGKFTMLTRPCIFTEKLPALGSEGDIMLVDFSQYAIGIRRELFLDRSQHVGWLTDTTGYRCIMRVDGKGTWDQAVTPKEGDSLSWCVTLAKRE